MNEKLPLLDNNARDVLCQATTKTGAIRWLKKNLPSETRALVDRYGFHLHVFPRSDLSIELNGGRRGWMYSIGK